jgi:hypothetical protein
MAARKAYEDKCKDCKWCGKNHHVEDKCVYDDEEEVEVYRVVCGIDALCGKYEHLKKFKTYSTEDGDYKTTYFETYGGGKQGGYFLRTKHGLDDDGIVIEEVYRVERDWGTPFVVEQIYGLLDYNEAGDGTAGTIRILKPWETAQNKAEYEKRLRELLPHL